MLLGDQGVCTPDLGPSLDVSFTPPGCRVCPFRCVYCAVPDAPRAGPGVRWPSPGALACAVANALPAAGGVDSLTIAGGGDPTLNPAFCAATLSVMGVVRRERPGMAVRVRTSGARIHRPEVRRALDLVDERVVKLDPAPERTARPGEGVHLGTLVAELTRLRDLSVQGVLVAGEAGNADPAALEAWIGLLTELRPRRVYLSTPAVPSSDRAALPLAPQRLAAACGQVADALGVPVELLPARTPGSRTRRVV